MIGSDNDIVASDRRLRRFAAQLTSSREDAEDSVQEAWLAALKQGASIKHHLRWLHTVVRRSAMRKIRRERLRTSIEFEASHGAARRQPRATDLELKWIVDAVEALNEPYREAIRLRYLEGMTLDELCRHLNCPEPTAKSRLHRGLNKLRLQLRRHHERSSRFSLLPLAFLGWRRPFGLRTWAKVAAPVLGVLSVLLTLWSFGSSGRRAQLLAIAPQANVESIGQRQVSTTDQGVPAALDTPRWPILPVPKAQAKGLHDGPHLQDIDVLVLRADGAPASDAEIWTCPGGQVGLAKKLVCTDRDGRASLRDVDRNDWISAQGPTSLRGSWTPLSAPSPAGRQGLPLTLFLEEESIPVHVTISDAAGKAAAGAQVSMVISKPLGIYLDHSGTWRRPSRILSQGVSDDQGRVELLGHGRFPQTIIVTHKSGVARRDLPSKTRPRPLHLVLDSEGAGAVLVRGVAVDRDGDPLPHHPVVVRTTQGDLEQGFPFFHESGASIASSTSDANGSFEVSVPEFETGRIYLLSKDEAGHVEGWSQVTNSRQGGAFVELQQAGGASAILRGNHTVEDKTQQQSQPVWILRGNSLIVERRCFPSESGEFEFRNLLEGSYELLAWNAGQPPTHVKALELDSGERLELGPLKLPVPSQLDIVLRDSAGNPLVPTRMRISRVLSAAWGGRASIGLHAYPGTITRIQPDLYECPPLSPGVYTLFAKTPDHAEVHRNFEVTAGARNVLQVDFERGRCVQLRVPECGPAQVHLRSAVGWERTVSLHGFPAGSTFTIAVPVGRGSLEWVASNGPRETVPFIVPPGEWLPPLRVHRIQGH